MHTIKQYTIKDTNSDLNSQYLCQNCHNDNIYIYTHTSRKQYMQFKFVRMDRFSNFQLIVILQFNKI